ncbi:MAG TPA: PIG-L deacetylase family protein [Candidatus Sulfotelmatobacter sp.]
MMHLNLRPGPSGALTVLCLGAHSDDLEIGCGGTILELGERYPGTKFHWVVFSANGVRQAEAAAGASRFAGAGLQGPSLKAFRDGFMPYDGSEIKAVFEELKPVQPDLIFTHRRDDAHQDHRLLSELTWNTFRDHLILEYEIPKYDGDMGQPSLFMPLKAETCQAKVKNLMEVFSSQRSKRWFEESTFLSLMRLRGMECNSASGYAEAFYCRKLVL